MKVDLPPDLEKMIADKVSAGQYPSASEVIHDALRLLEHQDRANRKKLERLRAALKVGEDDIAAGRVITVRSREDLEALFADL